MHAPMSRARYMQENRKMRFEEAYQGWTGGRLTQGEAALLMGQCERSFRRHVERYKADGLEGLLDKRLSQIFRRRASTAEIERVAPGRQHAPLGEPGGVGPGGL
jgi:Winged helix-turn helix